MAEARRDWWTWLAVGALGLGACGAVCAQSAPVNLGSPPAPSHSVEIQAAPSGSLAGRLTDLHSAPLAGVQVALHNSATGAEVRAVTAKNGAFRFAELEAGEYTLDADEPQLGHGRLEGILVTGGMEARVQAAMRFEAAAPELVEAAAPGEIAARARPAASMPLKAFAVTGTSGPVPASPGSAGMALALPFPAIPRAVLSTTNAEIVASLATEPLRTMTPAPRILIPAAFLPLLTVSRAALSTASPKTVALVATEPLRTMTTAPYPMPRPQLRAALETQSIIVEPALAVALPRTLPLTQTVAPTFSLNAAIASGMKAVLLLGQTAFSPVTAAAQKADPAATVVATTVTATQLGSLPAGGRRWQEFLLDTPAASSSPDSTQTSYRGSQESAEISIDGASTTLKFGAAAGSDSRSTALDPESQGADQQNAMSQAWSGGRGFGVSEAAIHEVTATAGNVEAEGMRSAGGRTGIETERGDNALHGQGFYFDRQNTWGARNPFTQWVQNAGTAAAPQFVAAPFTPPDHESVWGLGMGSRIRRDKLFWFGAIDGYRRNDPGLATVKNPAEFFNLPEPTSPAITLLSAQLGESMDQAYNDYLGATALTTPPSPQPAGPLQAAGLEQLAALLGPAPRTAAQWVGFARIDWQAAERHHFTLEAIGADWNAPGGGLTRVSETDGSHSFGSNHASQEWLLARWEAYLTPNLLAVTQGSAGRAILSARPETPSAFEQTLLNGNFWGQLPQIVVDSRYGLTIGNPSRFGQGSYPDEKLYHAQEMLDWVHNKVLIKAGFELDHDTDATSLLRNQTGTYHYSTVASFISDALAFEKFGFADALDARNPHNCGATDATWGSQPCYSSYSQTVGPTNWHLSTNDWAGYATAQWQAAKFAVFSAGLRWELEQMPPPIAALDNPELPFTEKLPSPGNNWGPRVSVAVGGGKRWPVLRLGYGMYYGRTENATIETALTQTGSLSGDLNFFMRPSDDCQFCSGGSPPFPYVFAGQPASVVKPGAVGFAPNFRNPEVHQAVAAVEQKLPSDIILTAGAMLSLGRRLPVYIDTNLAPPTTQQTITYTVCDQTPTGLNNGACGSPRQGPITAATITVPSYVSVANTGVASWLNPDYQGIDQITSMANSTYEAAMIKLAREGRRGLSLHAHYTYAHTTDWNPEESPAYFSQNSEPYFSQEYGTSNQDVRHSAAAMIIYEAPWKLRNLAGRFGNGWMLSGIGQFHSGLPYTMRVTGSIPDEIPTVGPGNAIVGLQPGMNGSGGDNRVYSVGRNTYRYPSAWKADLRLGKKFDLGEMRQLEVMAESFNLFNHQNVTEIETTGYTIEPGSPYPTLSFLTGLKTNPTTGLPVPAFGQPLNINGSDFYRERQIQIGMRMRF